MGEYWRHLRSHETHLTKAMILGGLLSRVWNSRLLMILNGVTSA